MSLYQEWLDAKENERAAIERRRYIEDELRVRFDVPRKQPKERKTSTMKAPLLR